MPNHQNASLHLELPRVQLIHIGTLCRSVKHKFGHELPRARSILDAPARVSGGDKHTRDRRGAEQGPTLLAEPHVSREVTCLSRLDGGGAKDGTDGADVRDEVFALVVVAFYEVCCLWEGNCRIWLSWMK